MTNGCKPVWVSSGKIVTATTPVTLNEWSRSEGLKAGAWGHQRLSRTLSTSISMLWKGRSLFAVLLSVHLCGEMLTIRKLYPVQSSCQLAGQFGTSVDWLWTAKALVGASQTVHLDMKTIMLLFTREWFINWLTTLKRIFQCLFQKLGSSSVALVLKCWASSCSHFYLHNHILH